MRSVLNLLSNAVKYSTDEKYIKVWVVRHSPEYIGIVVKDRGIGIDPEDLEKIFDRFYRAGDELTRGISGAGLGLSLIDQIVRAHGGEIQVESEKGRGSVFTILLPIVEDYQTQWPPPDLTISDDEMTGSESSSGQPESETGEVPAVVSAARRRSSVVEVIPSDLGEVEFDPTEDAPEPQDEESPEVSETPEQAGAAESTGDTTESPVDSTTRDAEA